MARLCYEYWWYCIFIFLILAFSVDFGTPLVAVGVVVQRNSCENKNCFPDESTIEQVAILEKCSKTIDVDDAAVSIVPGEDFWTQLPPCETCRVNIRASAGHKLTTTVYSLWTETDSREHCVKNRLDIYDGSKVDSSRLLSGPGGICGDRLPERSFQSSGNTMTIQLSTQCLLIGRVSQYGSFNLIVASVPAQLSCPGRFECQNGRQCVAKVFVCDGTAHCTDHSDEYGCRNRYPAWMVVLLVVAGVFVIGMFLSIAIWVCKRCCCPPTYITI